VDEAQGRYRVTLDGQSHALKVHPFLGSTHVRVQVDGAWHLVTIRRQDDDVLVAVGDDRFRVRVERALPLPRSRPTEASSRVLVEVRAPMPGLIVAAQVGPGARIEQGHPVVIMEAMKMQMEIRAPATGHVVAVSVHPGQEVAGGTLLATIELADPSRGHVVGG